MATTEQATGPLTDALERLGPALWDTLAANVPRDLHWQIILLTLLLATFLWWLHDGRGSRGADGRARTTGLRQYLLPRDIYTHISARVDVWLWITERVLRPLWAVALFASVGPTTEAAVINLLEWSLGASPDLTPNYAWMLLYSLVTLLCYDFVFYVIHYTMHKVPALWALHKVHHSAEVLTPLTRYREHFLAGPIWAAGAALSFGFAGGVFGWVFASGITAATLFNAGLFAVLFGFNGSFRHYHVQFHYPRWLSNWLQSPAMHHVHHSYLQPHWDTNFAAVTSLWDRLFGTLYVPVRDEYTPWGIGPDTQSDYRSYWQNTLGPFRDWAQMTRGGWSPQAGAQADVRLIEDAEPNVAQENR